MALVGARHMVLLWLEGLERLALRVAAATEVTKQAVCSIDGGELADPDMANFREFTVKLPGDAAAAVAHMDDACVLGGFALGEWWESMSTCLLIGCDERTSQTDIDALVAALSSWVAEVSV